MDAKIKEQLQEAGIDAESVKQRFMGNEMLVEKFMKKFPADQNFTKLKESLEAGDVKEAFTAAHTLKGVCGNLSMNRLFQVVDRQVELLRSGDLEGAKLLHPEVEKEYDTVIRVLLSWQ